MSALNLSPVGSDLSVQMLNQLLGTGWNSFAMGSAGPTAGSGLVLQGMFAIFNVALLGYVSALLLMQAFIGAAATAHEGTPLGKRYHSVWAPVRGPFSFLALVPLPWLKGFSLIQVTMLLLVSWSIGIADDVWGVFVQSAPVAGYSVTPPSSTNTAMALTSQLLKMEVATQYLTQNGGITGISTTLSKNWSTTNPLSGAGTYTFGFTDGGPDIDPRLGTVTIRCSNISPPSVAGVSSPQEVWGSSSGPISTLTDLASGFWSAVKTVGGAIGGAVTGANAAAVQNTPSCQAMVKTITSAAANVQPIAAQIVAMNAKSQGSAPVIAALQGAQESVQVSMDAAAKALILQETANQTASMTAFQQQAMTLGWASSAFYYYQLASVASDAQSQMGVLSPSFVLPNSDYIQTQASGWSAYVPSLNTYVDLTNSRYTQPDPAITGHTFLGITNPLVWILNQSLQIMASGNPLPEFVNVGNWTMAAGEAMFVLAVYVDAAKREGFISKTIGLVKNTVKTVAEAIIPGLEGDSVVTGVSTYLEATSSSIPAGFFMTLGGFLFVEGLILGYIIPSLPAMILIAAVIGWMFLVVELLVASPIWAVAHAYAEGEGFAPQQASYGYGAAIGVLMRPVAIVFGFAFSFYIIGIACWFAAMALGTFLSGMLTNVNVGPGSFVGVMSIILGTVFMVVRYTLHMITHLPDNLPRWMGGTGDNTGSTQAAESANQSTASSTQQTARGAAMGIKSTNDEMNSNLRQSKADAKERKREDADAIKETHNTQAAKDATKKAEQDAKEKFATDERRHKEILTAMGGGGGGQSGGGGGGGQSGGGMSHLSGEGKTGEGGGNENNKA